MVESELLQLIVAIYDAAADPALWPVFHQRYANMVSANFVGIQVHQFSRHESHFLSSYARVSGIGEPYNTYYNKWNIWRERGREFFQAGRLVQTEEHTPLALLDHSEFYNDFAKRAGVRYGFNAVLRRDDENATVFSVNGGEREGPFEDSALRVTQILLPHFSRALTIQERLAVLEAGEEMLNQIPAGIVFLSSAGRVVFANRAAGAMLRGKDSVEARQGVLHVLDSRVDAAWQHAVRRAAAPGNSHDCPEAMLLPRHSVQRPYYAIVAPLRCRLQQFAGTRAPVVVALLSDPDRGLAIDDDLLARLLGLTHAESRVAALLLNGRSTAEIAARLHIQRNTVRAHLKSMFGKTGARNQGDLIKLLLTSFATLPK